MCNMRMRLSSPNFLCGLELKTLLGGHIWEVGHCTRLSLSSLESPYTHTHTAVTKHAYTHLVQLLRHSFQTMQNL